MERKLDKRIPFLVASTIVGIFCVSKGIEVDKEALRKWIEDQNGVRQLGYSAIEMKAEAQILEGQRGASPVVFTPKINQSNPELASELREYFKSLAEMSRLLPRDVDSNSIDKVIERITNSSDTIKDKYTAMVYDIKINKNPDRAYKVSEDMASEADNLISRSVNHTPAAIFYDGAIVCLLADQILILGSFGRALLRSMDKEIKK